MIIFLFEAQLRFDFIRCRYESIILVLRCLMLLILHIRNDAFHLCVTSMFSLSLPHSFTLSLSFSLFSLFSLSLSLSLSFSLSLSYSFSLFLSLTLSLFFILGCLLISPCATSYMSYDELNL